MVNYTTEKACMILTKSQSPPMKCRGRGYEW